MFIQVTPEAGGDPLLIAIGIISNVSPPSPQSTTGATTIGVTSWPGYSSGTRLEVKESVAEIVTALTDAGYDVVQPVQGVSGLPARRGVSL